MANEIRVQSSFSIRNGSLNFDTGRLTAYLANMIGTRGPTPGSIVALTGAGTDINLSELDIPGGICFLVNLDPIGGNPVRFGVKDTISHKFYPMVKLLPGEFAVIRLDDELGNDYLPSGTFPADTGNTFHVRADNNPVNVNVFAFDA
jgi:hypothetical protein